MTKTELIQEIRDMLKHWLICKESWGEFVKGESYWIELTENGNFIGRSDNVKGKNLFIPVGILQSYFIVTNQLV